ncbi:MULTISPECIES: group III truncated hemoglobin [unclassified Flavobacterium]|uniref:group III truncated hemoglobin n=1 Tax=unclassified Flavobacterium TaxID=196869 RepID=UPI000F0D08D3|nr:MULTISPECIES: group III truncated hemoglobin [unclassified Flavobacterium]AYN02837.1 group III truncated hemoglobin [Flavobacterium sp. 140616W15]MCD0473054.1 group III truncated hemoglobin [Flavobacterium sp. EDS]
MVILDITTIEDIKLLVNTFYAKVQKDDLIGPIFNERIQGRWPEHLETMYKFWQTILLEQHSYSGSPFPPHKHLPVDQSHFNRWIEIFTKTVDSLFIGILAEEAKMRGVNMASMFLYKIEYFRDLKKTSK